MQPTYTAEAEAYREKVQAFLAEKLPSNWQGTGALEGDELDAFVAEWRNTLYEANYLAPGWPTEYGGGGPDRDRAGDPRRGVHEGGGARRRAERCVQHPDARQHLADVGDRRAEGALPAAPAQGRRHVVSGVLRARCRVRSRQRGAAGRTRRRRVDSQRPEDLDLGGSSRRSHLHPGAYRSRRPEAQGHLVHARPDGSARHRSAADQDDLGRQRVQRGVLHRRPRAEGQHRRWPEQRLGGGDVAPRLRAWRGRCHGTDPIPGRDRAIDRDGPGAWARR